MWIKRLLVGKLFPENLETLTVLGIFKLFVILDNENKNEANTLKKWFLNTCKITQ